MGREREHHLEVCILNEKVGGVSITGLDHWALETTQFIIFAAGTEEAKIHVETLSESCHRPV